MSEAFNSLTPQKRMFVLEYIKLFKVKAAAEAVNICVTTASKWMGTTEVQEAIASQMEAREQRTEIDSDWVLVQLGKMFDADLGDIFYPGTNDLRPVHEWPETWRKMSTGVKINAIYEGKGDDKTLVGHVKDVKILDRLKTLEMIGKHIDVQAFSEKVNIVTDDALNKRLLAGRQRARLRNSKEPDFM